MMEIFYNLFTTLISSFAQKAIDTLFSSFHKVNAKKSDKAIIKKLKKSLDEDFFNAVTSFFSNKHLWVNDFLVDDWIISDSDKEMLIHDFYKSYPDLFPFSSIISPMLAETADTLYSNLVKQLDFGQKVLLAENNKNAQNLLLSQAANWEKQKGMFEQIILRLPNDPRATSFRNLAAQRHSLLFNNVWIDLVKFDQELLKLKDFLLDQHSLSWWAITGQGGIGKSRISWELASFAVQEGYWVYYSKSSYENIIEDAIFEAKKLLLIFDDTLVNIDSIANIISNIIHDIHQNQIVRILFIDRNGTSAIDSPWLKLLFEKCPDAYFFLKNQCFDNESKFQQLQRMSDAQLKQIIKNYLSSQRTEIDNRTLNLLVENLHENADDSHNDKCYPLYALVIADGWLNNRKTTWNLKHCFEDQYLRELGRLEKTLAALKVKCSFSEIMKLVCISTVQNTLLHTEEQPSVFVEEIRSTILSLDHDTCLPALFRKIGFFSLGNSDRNFSISGIRPDIMGENFVFRYFLADNENTDKCVRFLDTIWKDPVHTVNFLVHLYHDFKEEVFDNTMLTDYFLNMDISSFGDSQKRKYYCMFLLHLGQIKIRLSSRCTEKLKALYHYYKDNDVAWRYASLIYSGCKRHTHAYLLQFSVNTLAEIYKENKTKECYSPYFKALEHLRDLQQGLDQILTIKTLNDIKNDFLLD